MDSVFPSWLFTKWLNHPASFICINTSSSSSSLSPSCLYTGTSWWQWSAPSSRIHTDSRGLENRSTPQFESSSPLDHSLSRVVVDVVKEAIRGRGRYIPLWCVIPATAPTKNDWMTDGPAIIDDALHVTFRSSLWMPLQPRSVFWPSSRTEWPIRNNITAAAGYTRGIIIDSTVSPASGFFLQRRGTILRLHSTSQDGDARRRENCWTVKNISIRINKKEIFNSFFVYNLKSWDEIKYLACFYIATIGPNFSLAVFLLAARWQNAKVIQKGLKKRGKQYINIGGGIEILYSIWSVVKRPSSIYTQGRKLMSGPGEKYIPSAVKNFKPHQPTNGAKNAEEPNTHEERRRKNAYSLWNRSEG